MKSQKESTEIVREYLQNLETLSRDMGQMIEILWDVNREFGAAAVIALAPFVGVQLPEPPTAQAGDWTNLVPDAPGEN